MKPACPLDGNINIVLKKRIETKNIAESYALQYKLDVGRFFKGVEFVYIYKCQCGYQFFYPLNVAGDSAFYSHFEQYPWYYMDWKWEHEIALQLLERGEKILEIGCGTGGFLKKIMEKGFRATGLELNQNSLKIGQEKNLDILAESAEEHAKKFEGYYDVICSFQVLEHVAEAGNMIKNSLKLLRSGGKIIISVPNNIQGSPIIENNILNMPPHHMGLWDATSLIGLQKSFDMRLERIFLEPLQKYHFDIFHNFIKDGLIKEYGFFGKIINKASGPVVKQVLKNLSSLILGHSIVAQYKKISG
jgi:2-polyprenyl-3-methyl-5-hydroxy-6-metoxy-1,4-benzoquinol methylase